MRILERERTIPEIARMMGVSNWTARRRLSALGVLRRIGPSPRSHFVVTLARLSKVLPDLFHTRAPNRDEIEQLQKELTDMRKQIKTLRARVARLETEKKQ